MSVMRALLLASVVACGSTGIAEAAVVIKIRQSGANLIATGSGSLDTSNLVRAPYTGTNAWMLPSSNRLILGPFGLNLFYSYGIPLNGPSSFGTGFGAFASSGNGSILGFDFSFGQSYIAVPYGYVSGDPLNSSSVFNSASFSSFGLTPGVYTYSFGSGVDLDTITVQIVAATTVPEPASLALLGMGVAGIAAVRRRRVS